MNVYRLHIFALKIKNYKKKYVNWYKLLTCICIFIIKMLNKKIYTSKLTS